MDNLKVSTRLLLLIGILSCILIAVGASGLYGMGQSNDSLKSVYQQRVAALEKVGDVNYLVQRNRVLAMDMLLQPTPENVKKRNKELQANVESINKTNAAFMAGPLSPAERSLADAFGAARKAYVQEGTSAPTRERSCAERATRHWPGCEQLLRPGLPV